MKYFNLRSVFYFTFLSLFTATNFAQIDYQVRVDELFSASDDSDGSGNEDPVWKLRMNDDDGGVTQFTGCITVSKSFNSWWSGSPSTGVNIPYAWFTRTNTNAANFATAMEAWEDDACSSTCSYNGCWINSDDAHAPAGTSNGTYGTTQSIDIFANPPCTWNQYTTTLLGDNNNGTASDYRAHISVNWTVNGGVNPGVIGGAQTICSGGDPTPITNTNGGTATNANYGSWFTYQWQIDAGCTGTWVDISGATGATFDPGALTQNTCYRRVMQSACGDVNSNEITITVNASSVAPVTLTPSTTTICDAGSVDFTVAGGSLGAGAQWEIYAGGCASGAVVGSGTGTITIPVTATTDYFVLASGTCNTTGCAPGVTINFSTSSTLPSGVTSSAGASICGGTSTTLSITGGVLGSGANWEWYDGGCGTGSNVGSGSSINVSPAVTTTYYVRSESPGCGNSTCQSITITVNPGHVLPTSINASNNNFCAGGSVDLTQMGGTPAAGATWTWYEGGCGTGTSIGTGNSITGLTPSTTTTYYVRAEGGSCGTSACMNVTVNVDQLPTTANAGSDFDVCGNSGTLSANSPSTGTGTWSTISGPGTISSPAANNSGIANLSFVTPTVFEWSVSNGSCPASTSQVTVTAYDTPSASVAGSDQNLCNVTTATLGATAPAVGTGTWSTITGGGTVTSTNMANSGVTGLAVGTNTFQWEVTNGSCPAQTSTVDIVIDQNSTDPTGAFAASTNICSGMSTTLQVTGGTLGTGAQWVWHVGSATGPILGNGAVITTPPLVSNTTYVVVGEGNCNNTTPIPVSITVGAGAAAPTAATAINNNICPGDTARIYVTGGVLPSGYTWVWYTGACGAIPVGIGDTIAVTPNATTDYYVRATGTCGSTTCEMVTVNVQSGSIPATGILFTNNSFCPGGSTTLSVDGGSLVSGALWTWYENSCGGTSIGTGNSITVSPSSTTSYYVRGEGGSCGNTTCVDVAVNVLDAYVYMVAFDDACGVGAPYDLSNGLPVGGTYSGNGVYNDMFYPDSAGVGTHTITYTITTDNGCTVSANADVTIGTSSITVNAVPQVEACANGGVTIVGTASGGSGLYNYKWSTGATGNPLMFVEPGTYSLTVTDADNCSATIGGIEITEELACLDVANTFTPNGDGTNDTWNLDFSTYTSASLQVFSKWGTLVYQSDGLTIKWDGTGTTGAQLPSGTYYYIIELDGGSKTQNGPISIVR